MDACPVKTVLHWQSSKSYLHGYFAKLEKFCEPEIHQPAELVGHFRLVWLVLPGLVVDHLEPSFSDVASLELLWRPTIQLRWRKLRIVSRLWWLSPVENPNTSWGSLQEELQLSCWKSTDGQSKLRIQTILYCISVLHCIQLNNYPRAWVRTMTLVVVE